MIGYCESTSTARREYPERGAAAEPLMNKRTSYELTSVVIVSLIVLLFGVSRSAT
jgi:hypothetical protein